MTLYGKGARRAELAHLQISDIDSRRMVIHIRGGKGRQDRDDPVSSPFSAPPGKSKLTKLRRL